MHLRPCWPLLPLLDLPVLLQSLRGCYRLKRLALSGNPVTQEKSFRAYLMKAVPSLEEVEDKETGVAVKCSIGRNRSSTALEEVVASSNVYRTCLRQIEEQDKLKEVHSHQLK